LINKIYLYYFFLDEKVFKKSRQNDASAHRPLRWPAVLPGLAFYRFLLVSLSQEDIALAQ
jgi:hypothetical protein